MYNVTDMLGNPISVFAKLGSNAWEYLGTFRAVHYSQARNEIDLRAVKADRDGVVGVLFFRGNQID